MLQKNIMDPFMDKQNAHNGQNSHRNSLYCRQIHIHFPPEQYNMYCTGNQCPNSKRQSVSPELYAHAALLLLLPENNPFSLLQ